MNTVLSLIDVHFEYINNKILNGLTLEIKQGEIVSLLGPSGSGKSTIIQLLLGFESPTSGTININENIVSNNGTINVQPENRDLAVVFQDLALWPHLTVYENLEFGLKVKKITPLKRQQLISKTLDQLGLNKKEQRYPSQLSGGEKQRVAIARALVQHPKAILMDEPLSHLDVSLKKELLFTFRQIFKSKRSTVLYVTHDLKEAASLGDRLVVIEKGQIVQQGTLSDLRQHQATNFVKSLVDDLSWDGS